ncbi:unnamed protein product [Moneuplotes crassus]|uniref:Uncharacterized protein n=1 Tax=Euplotes crassus TaxID=5936 RepID=A0AAD1UCT6_EUPCR|nr:unnamed protein product [Moneuplotes crassus]
MDKGKDSDRSNPSINLQTVPTYNETEFGSSPVTVNNQKPNLNMTIKCLNSYINELVKENERLQNIVDDTKTTNLLNKQMLNDYAQIINEKEEENIKLQNQLENCQKEIQELKENQEISNDKLSDRESQKENQVERFSQLFNSDDFHNAEKQKILIKKLMEMMKFYESSDDEPELTSKRFPSLLKDEDQQDDPFSSNALDNSEESQDDTNSQPEDPFGNNACLEEETDEV